MKHWRILPVLGLLCMLLAGCQRNDYSAQEAKQLCQRAEAMVSAYLETAEPGAEILSSREYTSLNTGTFAFELTDCVTGSYRSSGAEYQFAVNTGTGEIYTSRRMAEFEGACVDLLLERYGLEATALRYSVELSILAEQPDQAEEPVLFQNVLPVTAEDLTAYAAAVLEDPRCPLEVQILYTGDPMEQTDFFSGIRTAESRVRLYRLPDDRAGEIAALDLGYAECFAEESATVTADNLSYIRWTVYDLEGVLIQAPLWCISPAEGTYDVDPETDFQVDLSEGLLEITARDRLYGYLLLPDLSPAEGQEEALVKNRLTGVSGANKKRLLPQLDRWVLSGPNYAIPEKLRNGDLVALGRSGRERLENEP